MKFSNLYNFFMLFSKFKTNKYLIMKDQNKINKYKFYKI
jgi:hypothetical protein